MKLFLLSCTLMLTACIACAPINPPSQQTGLLFVDATVQRISGNDVTVALKLPDVSKASESFIADLAHQTVQKCLFFEGLKTDVNGLPATVREIRGTIVTLVFGKPQSYQVNSTIQLRVPKKTIAVMDFEVIRGNKKETGRASMENLTSALINSGHFIVVERSKLKTILDEQALSLSGLTKEPAEKLIGNLLSADLILTGTLAELDSTNWDINLRLLNVKTGQAMAAIAMRTSLFKPQELRDTGSLDDDFEKDAVNSSWRTGYRKKGLYVVSLDTSQGAGGSNYCMKIEFDFTEKTVSLNGMKNNRRDKPIFAQLQNGKKRDVLLYTGVEFMIKADQPLTGKFNMLTSVSEDPNRMDAWVADFDIGSEWKMIRIPFDSMNIGRRWIKRGAAKMGARPGDQILRLDRVESVIIGVDSGFNPPVKGTVWIDNVSFYPKRGYPFLSH